MPIAPPYGMEKKKSSAVGSAFILFAAVLSGCGISPTTTGTTSTSSASSGAIISSSTTTNLSLGLSTDSVLIGGLVQLSASGGVSPYSYGVVSGSGTIISGTNLFTAGSTAGTVVVAVEDSAGSIAQATITVTSSSGSSALSVSYTPNPVYVSESVIFTTLGGVSPYTYTSLNSVGSFSGNVYTAPSAAGTAQIQVKDADGNATVIALTISAAVPFSISAFTELSVSQEGLHIVGGPGCGNKYEDGGIADAGNGKIQGNQIFCSLTQKVSGDASVIENIMITPGGGHIVGGPGCPSGYDSLGTITDCTGATCYGNQNVCVLYGTLNTASQVVTSFYLTPESEHIDAGPGCSPGYTQVGNSADCGGGKCGGNQDYCVQYSNL